MNLVVWRKITESSIEYRLSVYMGGSLVSFLPISRDDAWRILKVVASDKVHYQVVREKNNVGFSYTIRYVV